MRLTISLLLASIAAAQTPLERALNYLAAEVPSWRENNGCFSCHNNGDGARALYAVGRLEPATSTTAWLNAPQKWDQGKMDEAYSDKTLALYQFAAGLTSAVEAGAIRDRSVLTRVAKRLIEVQNPDGSWRVEDSGDAPGSPVTWGSALATYFARRALLADGEFRAAASRAENWLHTLKPRYTHDQAAVLLALPNDAAVRKQAIERFSRTQTSDGGWGPRAGAPAEVFDTAIVLLALEAANEKSLIARGREYLIRTQQAAGGWPETTRPSGSQSYAQHISTTAWAAMALLRTDPDRQ